MTYTTFEMQENKKKIIIIIKDYIRTPTDDPLFRYEAILLAITKLHDDGGLSETHTKFLTHVLEIECEIILADMVDMGKYAG